MRFEPRLLDDIRSRIRLSDLVGREVALKRQGREFAGLSPFNKEKTPSFFVNDEKRFYHCFSSGKHGDAFTWLMETQGLSFPEAVEYLAEETGVQMPARDPKAIEAAKRVEESISWLEAAQTFFAAQLRRSGGAEARAYLERRGLPEESWNEFEIGFAPEGWSGLKDELIAKGAKPQQLLEAGLIASAREGDRTFDYFRNRIMFAIRDPSGRLAGFGGRALDPDDRAKYLNSREDEHFHKGRLLYRYPQARAWTARASDAERALGPVVAEGYMDVIALARAGFGGAVAPLGTALTEDQLDLLWRLGEEPILCFDGDAAGVRAAYRALDRALPKLKPGMSLRIAFLPEGLDPDDLVRTQGARAMREALQNAAPMVEVLWRREREHDEADTPERKAGLKQRLFAAAAKVEDKNVAEQYRRALLEKFDEAFRPARRAPGRFQRRWDGPDTRGATVETMARRAQLRVARGRAEAVRLLAALMDRPQLLSICAEALAALPLDDSAHEEIRDALLAIAGETFHIDKSALLDHLAGTGNETAADRVLEDALSVAPIWADEVADDEAASLWEREAAEYLRRSDAGEERAALILHMRHCRESGDSAELAKAARALAALKRVDAAKAG